MPSHPPAAFCASVWVGAEPSSAPHSASFSPKSMRPPPSSPCKPISARVRGQQGAACAPRPSTHAAGNGQKPACVSTGCMQAAFARSRSFSRETKGPSAKTPAQSRRAGSSIKAACLPQGPPRRASAPCLGGLPVPGNAPFHFQPGGPSRVGPAPTAPSPDFPQQEEFTPRRRQQNVSRGSRNNTRNLGRAAQKSPSSARSERSSSGDRVPEEFTQDGTN